MLIIWLLETQLRTGLPAILTAQKQESGEKGMGYNDQLACYGSVPLIYGEGKTQRFSLYREVQLLGPEWKKKKKTFTHGNLLMPQIPQLQ